MRLYRVESAKARDLQNKLNPDADTFTLPARSNMFAKLVFALAVPSGNVRRDASVFKYGLTRVVFDYGVAVANVVMESDVYLPPPQELWSAIQRPG